MFVKVRYILAFHFWVRFQTNQDRYRSEGHGESEVGRGETGREKHRGAPVNGFETKR